MTADSSASALPSGERKLVTLVFADLAGFTELASSLDPEEVYAFVRPGLDAMQRIVEEHGGTGKDAMAAFSLAVERWRRLGLTVWLGRALALQAAAARRAGDPAEADQLLTKAAAVLDRVRTPARSRPGVLAPLPAGGPPS